MTPFWRGGMERNGLEPYGMEWGVIRSINSNYQGEKPPQPSVPQLDWRGGYIQLWAVLATF